MEFLQLRHGSGSTRQRQRLEPRHGSGRARAKGKGKGQRRLAGHLLVEPLHDRGRVVGAPVAHDPAVEAEPLPHDGGPAKEMVNPSLVCRHGISLVPQARMAQPSKQSRCPERPWTHNMKWRCASEEKAHCLGALLWAQESLSLRSHLLEVALECERVLAPAAPKRRHAGGSDRVAPSLQCGRRRSARGALARPGVRVPDVLGRAGVDLIVLRAADGDISQRSQ